MPVFNHAVINASSSGDNTVVAAVPGKKIRVNNYLLIAAGTVTATWKSGANAKSGPLPLIANSGAAAPGTYENRWFETNAGEALILTLSDAIAVGGHLTYTV